MTDYDPAVALPTPPDPPPPPLLPLHSPGQGESERLSVSSDNLPSIACITGKKKHALWL